MPETLTPELVNQLRSKITLLDRQVELKNMYISQLEAEMGKGRDQTLQAPNGGTVTVTELSSANVEIQRLNELLANDKSLLDSRLTMISEMKQQFSELESKNKQLAEENWNLNERIKELEHSQPLPLKNADAHATDGSNQGTKDELS